MAFAIVPACGSSSRMGRPKLTLPLGDLTVIERVVASLRDGGVDRVLVVVGAHVPELRALAESAGALVLVLPVQTPDMRATVEHGLAWVEEQYRPNPDDCWILAPADHPAFSPSVVRELLRSATLSNSIIVPICDGRRGHPVLLRWRHAEAIRSLPSNEGINSFLRARVNEILELPVNEPGVLANLDTPEDYERLRRTHL